VLDTRRLDGTITKNQRQTEYKMTEQSNKDLDVNSIINELSIQIANYAKDNAILKSMVKTLTEELSLLKSAAK
jgi:hypothetical protein